MAEGLGKRMVIGLLVGSVLGVLAHLLLPGTALLSGVVEYVTEPLGKLFLRLLFMLVVPLIVSALVLGVAGLGDLRRVGRLGALTLAYSAFVSSLAVLIGVGLVNLVRPGAGMADRARAVTEAAAGTAQNPATSPHSPIDFFLSLVPQNPIKAMADGDMLAVMVFSLLFGIALVSIKSEPAARLTEVIEGIYQVTMKLLSSVIQLAPYGVACLLFTATARFGYDVLVSLSSYVLVVLVGLGLQLFGVYSGSVALLAKSSPRAFFRAVRPAMLTAFSTASSNETLPTALLVAEERLRLPSEVSRFVLTIGSTANQNGTALFEGVTVLFLAQAFGVELSLAQQLLVVAICVLGGIGTAGVPAGSIPVIAMILGMVGVPPEGIGIVLGVDRLLDMCRTTVNVIGDLAAAVVISAHAPLPREAPEESATA
jgi:DAACS family dicarboxylate/amino acid:cation (Na+ or H+) symporter